MSCEIMVPEISVVIPAYNAAKYLANTITSVIEQDFANWEIILINDGSTDNTIEVANKFLHDSRIHLITQSNRGVSAARNAGIKLSKGQYIAFLDADDEFLPNNLSVKYNILLKQPDADFIYSDVFFCNNNMETEFIPKVCRPEDLFKQAILSQKEVIPAFSSNIMVKTSIMKGDLLFNENLSNCADRFMKIMLGIKVRGMYINQPLVKYRNTPGSMSKNVLLLDKDENYIISVIKDNKITANPLLRRRAISNIYMMLSGSWYKDAHKTSIAWRYAFKAIKMYPPSVLKLLFKSVELLSKR